MNPNLTGVPETMLWTLHNRANEAARPDGVLRDPDAIGIYEALDYDFERSFGPAEPSHGVRSAFFDAELRRFLDTHPDGVIVNLGEGLETQRYRVEGPDALWLTVDLPDAIAVRERFIQPDDQHRHVPRSALDRAWLDELPPGRAVYVTAQGLLMYFEEEAVRALMQDMAARLPGAWLCFDCIPRWFSEKTLKGFRRTAHYETPPMPWGINRDEIEPTLRAWIPDLAEVEEHIYRFPRGAQRWAFPIMRAIPILNRHIPALVRLRFGPAPKTSAGATT